MIEFKATFQRFAEQGEKTGWTYIDVPFDVANKVKPNQKKSFRVKGKIDGYVYKGVSLLPMGEGNFIFAVNATIRKNIKKRKGETVIMQMEEDKALLLISADLLACLSEEPTAKSFFETLPKSHQNYFSKWIESAKTDATKAKRIAQAVNAFTKNMGYSEMMRANKENKLY